MRPARRSFLAAAAAALVGAVAVGQADGQVSANILSVACEGQTATLSMQDNEATYTCENGSNGNKMMVADFEVHVQASEVTLNLQNDYTLRTL